MILLAFPLRLASTDHRFGGHAWPRMATYGTADRLRYPQRCPAMFCYALLCSVMLCVAQPWSVCQGSAMRNFGELARNDPCSGTIHIHGPLISLAVRSRRSLALLAPLGSRLSTCYIALVYGAAALASAVKRGGGFWWEGVSLKCAYTEPITGRRWNSQHTTVTECEPFETR